MILESFGNVTFWKLKKSGKDKVAVSRVFGDFDYKMNDSLTVHDKQAIVSIPEIQIYSQT